MPIEKYRAVGCDRPIYIDTGYQPERAMQDYGLDILGYREVPISAALWAAGAGVKHEDILVAMDDRRTSTDGKEIITGDTVGGDDKPQVPDTQDDKK